MSSGRLNPVAWTEGMFLRPQHFQQHDVYLEERLRYHLHVLNPFHWGVRELSINEDALADHRFEIQQLEAVMPGGTVVKAGVNAVVEPRPFDPASERFSVYVGMRHVSESESAVTAAQGDAPDARYRIVEKELPDVTRAGALAPVDLAYPHLRLFFSGEEQELELYEWFKLADVVGTGVHPPFVLARDYCPPLLAVQGFPPLADRIDQIVAQIAAKVRVVAGRTSSTLAIADLPRYWMRYTLQRATPMLRHLLSTGTTSPFQLYTALVDVAGALAAFNTSEPADLPAYDHEDLLGCFGGLLAFLDVQLAEAVPDRFVELVLPFDAEAKLYASEDLNTDTVDPHKHYYLAVKADLEASELARRVVEEAKVGARSTVKLAVRANIAGVPLEHLPGAPTEIQARAGFQYFRLDPHHSKWKKIQEDYDFAVALPRIESADVRLYVVDEAR
jgi:type VI secretion system protein ImpJ